MSYPAVLVVLDGGSYDDDVDGYPPVADVFVYKLTTQPGVCENCGEHKDTALYVCQEATVCLACLAPDESPGLLHPYVG